MGLGEEWKLGLRSPTFLPFVPAFFRGGISIDWFRENGLLSMARDCDIVDLRSFGVSIVAPIMNSSDCYHFHPDRILWRSTRGNERRYLGMFREASHSC
ncbi:hypothetical protein I7I48_09184 [Histoplasma ohiense]|nr:hypothetical protein I7I48_09184 [Histoplasma ohiense (nom. inval.)]